MHDFDKIFFIYSIDAYLQLTNVFETLEIAGFKMYSSYIGFVSLNKNNKTRNLINNEEFKKILDVLVNFKFMYSIGKNISTINTYADVLNLEIEQGNTIINFEDKNQYNAMIKSIFKNINHLIDYAVPIPIYKLNNKYYDFLDKEMLKAYNSIPKDKLKFHRYKSYKGYVNYNMFIRTAINPASPENNLIIIDNNEFYLFNTEEDIFTKISEDKYNYLIKELNNLFVYKDGKGFIYNEDKDLNDIFNSKFKINKDTHEILNIE